MRHYSNNNPEWVDWTYIVCMSGLFCALIAGAIARSAPTQKHQALERLDYTCPLGSYTEGNYCKLH